MMATTSPPPRPTPPRPSSPPSKPFRRWAYFYKKAPYGDEWKRRFFKLDVWTIRYYKSQDSSTPKGSIDLSKARGVRVREHCKVEWPPQAKPHLCFGIATETRTYYLYATDLQSIQPWITEIHRIIIERVGRMCTDWENDIEGKPESDSSKRTRGAVHVASLFAKGVAESGALSDKSSLALKTLATVAEGQAATTRNTTWKERAKLGVVDGLRGLKKDEPDLYQNGQGLINPMEILMMQQRQMERLLDANAQLAGLTAGTNSTQLPPTYPPANTLQPGPTAGANPTQLPLTYPGNGYPLANNANAQLAGLTAGANSTQPPPTYYPPANNAVGGPVQPPPGAYDNINSSWQQTNALAEDLVPLYRYWKGSRTDHFYTTNIEEIGTAIPQTEGRFGYTSEGIQCLIYSKPKTGTVPLYRYWSGGHVIDHFYTTNAGEIGTVTKGQVGAHGYVSEGIAGYCFPNAVPGTLPLYRYYAAHAMDHFYTTNSLEVGTTIAGETGLYGYRSEGIVGYVYPYTG